MSSAPRRQHQQLPTVATRLPMTHVAQPKDNFFHGGSEQLPAIPARESILVRRCDLGVEAIWHVAVRDLIAVVEGPPLAMMATGLAFVMHFVMQGILAHLGWETTTSSECSRPINRVVTRVTRPLATMTFVPVRHRRTAEGPDW